jgi:hypothetical protein
LTRSGCSAVHSPEVGFSAIREIQGSISKLDLDKELLKLKKCCLLFSAALLTAAVAAATDMPSAEAYFGYNLVHFSPNSSFIPSFNAHGGVAQFVYNFHSSVGVVVDLGAVNQSGLLSTNINNRLFNFVVGPRYTFRKHSRFQPYGQVLVGGATASSSAKITLLPGGIIWPPPSWAGVPILSQPVEAEFERSRTGFALLTGVGLDIKLGKHVAFRPVEADYFMTRFPSILAQDDINRHHFRYSAGINFLFGAR